MGRWSGRMAGPGVMRARRGPGRAAVGAQAGGAPRRGRLGGSGLLVSEVCLGTMTFGEQNSEAEARALLDSAWERGVNFLDTSEIYPVRPAPETQGLTSEYIGRWLAARPRDSAVVATKVSGRSEGLEWVPANRTKPRGVESNPKLDALSIRAGVEAELRRLRTDYIDLLQLHWPDRYRPNFGANQYKQGREWEAVPFEEQVGALKELVEEGKVRYWGLSNESTFGVCSFSAAARQMGAPPPVSIQNSFSLVGRSFESDLAEACCPDNLNLGLLPWSPLAGGALSGKYLSGEPPLGSRFALFPGRYDRFNSPRVREAVRRYSKLAKEAGMTPAQLALKFCRSRPYVASTIIGATNLVQLAENLDAFAGDGLPEDVLRGIDDIHLAITNPSHTD